MFCQRFMWLPGGALSSHGYSWLWGPHSYWIGCKCESYHSVLHPLSVLPEIIPDIEMVPSFILKKKKKRNSPSKQKSESLAHNNIQPGRLYPKLGKLKEIYITARQTTETKPSISLFPNHLLMESSPVTTTQAKLRPQHPSSFPRSSTPPASPLSQHRYQEWFISSTAHLALSLLFSC